MKPAERWTVLALGTALVGGIAGAQTTERVSVDSAGAQAIGNSGTFSVAVSADGRWVVFDSIAANLVAGDTNQNEDVFLRDRQNLTTERVSVATGGTQANGFSGNSGVSISAAGSFVAFDSAASNLVAGDTNGAFDIFVHDRQTGTTERVSVSSSGVQGNASSQYPAISADGRFVVFSGASSNLVTGDTNVREDVFVRDRQLGTTERVSVTSSGTQGNGHSYYSSISADGRFVAYSSESTNLVSGDTNAVLDVFVRDRQLGTTERVSVDSLGAQGNGFSYRTAISADGRCVAFESNATNLVAGDTNGFSDTFLRDRQLGTTERVSVDSSAAEGNAPSFPSAISSDGLLVAFAGGSSNLVAGDTNGNKDVFLRDRSLPPTSASCFGDGSAAACPCGNSGAAGRGCENSAATGGAQLAAAGSPSLASDTLVLTSSGELPSALSIFLQGDAAISPSFFGDGLRCTGGALKRLYVRNASGVVSAPQPGDPSISTRSMALGDLIGAGDTRHYQTYYRDAQLTFCGNPPGNSWNISSGISVHWAQ